jgi:hypothetical protein
MVCIKLFLILDLECKFNYSLFYSEKDVKSFKITRNEKANSSEGRIVRYFTENKRFKCSCGYTQISGFVCRHIFRTGIQLNLNELPSELYLYRWRKDPNEHVIFEHYKNFYSNSGSNVKSRDSQ